ncbi:MAG: FlgD immunoglobulin-like domain containing protein [Candidatus Cloacimonadales bacterium]
MKTRFMVWIFSIIFVSLSAQNIWINEFHYDNEGTDVDEFIEIVFEMAPGDDLADYEIFLYNGSNNGTYDSVNLADFTAGDVVEGFSFFYKVFPSNGIQNGAPDGIALAYAGSLVQFISYEGTMTGADGPAAGVMSEDIGVEESSSTPIGYSLQLTGTGAQYSHFSWMEPQPHTMGQLNPDQSFGGTPDPTITVTSPNGGEEWEQGTTHAITWNSVSFEGNVTIELYESWETAEVLAADIANSGSWEWEIPADQTAHPNYSITISATEGGEPTDSSNNEFAIIEPIQANEYTIYEIQYTEDASGDSPHLGELVTTSGVVTAIFSNTFFIQDGAGAWNGLCVYPNTFDISDLAVGNEIEVTAMVDEYNGKTELLDLQEIVVLNETAELPAPEIIMTGEIVLADLHNPEAWEGVLVQMENVTVTDPDLGYGEWEIDDGLDFSAPCMVGAAGEYSYEPIVEDTFSALVGIVDFSYGNFKLEPRDDADLMTSALTIEPAILEFLSYEDCENGKTFTLTNSGDTEIMINDMFFDADFSGATAHFAVEYDFPITLAAGAEEEVLVLVGLIVFDREIEEGSVQIETSIGNYQVTLHYDNELNSNADQAEIAQMETKLSNYPNPFNPTTNISFTLAEAADDSEIVIYNSKGQVVKTFSNSQLTAGQHSVIWNGTDDNGDSVTSGIYFYRLLEAGNSIATKKMMLLK